MLAYCLGRYTTHAVTRGFVWLTLKFPFRFYDILFFFNLGIGQKMKMSFKVIVRDRMMSATKASC